MTDSEGSRARALVLAGGPLNSAELDDRPGRELIYGVAVAVVFFGLFLGWTLFAPLDVAAYASGTIAVEGHRQTIQHQDGGVISHIFVKEGDYVQPGQVLISLAPSDVEAGEQSMSSQLIDLESQRARLLAEQQGLEKIPQPPEFASLTGDEKAEADRALDFQQREMSARRLALGAQKRILAERGEQLTRAIQGYRSQIASVDAQSQLIGDELKGMQDLASKGYAPMTRVRALQRDNAGMAGQRGDLTANAARSEAQIGEVHMQSLSLDTDRSEEVAKDLRDVSFQIDDLLPKVAALKQRLAEMQIRSPVAGQVIGLSVFTVGGVIAPGQKLMDIVPKSAPMVIDAQIPANSMDGLYIGQSTQIRIASMHDRRMPILWGKITELSSDSLVDEKSGIRYYSMEVTVPEWEIKRVSDLRGSNGGLRIGLPVEVIIPTRKRTAWQYLTEPLTQALWTSFRER